MIIKILTICILPRSPHLDAPFKSKVWNKKGEYQSKYIKKDILKSWFKNILNSSHGLCYSLLFQQCLLTIFLHKSINLISVFQ